MIVHSASINQVYLVKRCDALATDIDLFIGTPAKRQSTSLRLAHLFDKLLLIHIYSILTNLSPKKRHHGLLVCDWEIA